MFQKLHLTLLALVCLVAFNAPKAWACDEPTNLSATVNAGYSCHFAWNAVGGADSYNFQLYHENSPQPGNTYNITTNAVDLTLLFCGNYYLKVQAVCGGVPSTWASLYFANPITVTCLPDPGSCTPPTSFTVAYNSGNNGFDLSWPVMNNNLYFIKFKPSNGGTWGPPINVTTNIYNSTIQNCQSYDYQVQHICGPGYYSNWSTTQTYNPQTAPSGLFESAVGTTTATLDWTAIPGATYSVKYRRVGGSWTTVSASTNQKSISGLKKNSNYEWKVAAICSGVTGPFSVNESFMTSANKTDFESFEAISTSLELFPNPANDAVTLQIAVATETTATVVVMDITGKMLLQSKHNLIEGSQQIPMQLANLESGLYLVTVTLDTGEKMLKKLVVAR